MSNVVEKARKLKSDAMDARDDGHLDRAETLIKRAEQVLRDALRELKSNRKETEKPGSLETAVANQLLHVLGSKGGIYRRMKDYAGSALAYDDGYEFEGPESVYGIVNSYNLVQRLVSRVLLRPESVDDVNLEVLKLPVRDALFKAKQEIQRQLKGPRAEDEYAAADLALVCLLLGDSEWEQALDDFINAERPPEPYAVKVTAELINELHEAIPPTSGALRKRLAQAIDEFKWA